MGQPTLTDGFESTIRRPARSALSSGGGAEEALHDSRAMLHFVGIDLGN